MLHQRRETSIWGPLPPGGIAECSKMSIDGQCISSMGRLAQPGS